MLGTEPQIIETYVNSGQVRIIFWPVLNHGNPSLFATLAAECAGRQNPDAFWTMHAYLFANQSQLYGADRDYFLTAAESMGLDREQFAACYDDEQALANVTTLDQIRRDRGIRSQPVFDINGQTLFGAQPFSVFQQVIDAALP